MLEGEIKAFGKDWDRKNLVIIQHIERDFPKTPDKCSNNKLKILKLVRRIIFELLTYSWSWVLRNEFLCTIFSYPEFTFPLELKIRNWRMKMSLHHFLSFSYQLLYYFLILFWASWPIIKILKWIGHFNVSSLLNLYYNFFSPLSLSLSKPDMKPFHKSMYPEKLRSAKGQIKW